MYSVDSLCPSGILSSSKRQLCLQEPFPKPPEHRGLGTGCSTGQPRVAAPIPERAEGQTCPRSPLSTHLTFLVTLLSVWLERELGSH